ncbi:MAG: 2-oxoacid:acceptor oxidoreductase family protein, partial [Myxococcota bacterium]
EEAIEYLVDRGEKVGLVKVRLYRPFAADAFVKALPATTKKIAVLDRTKEPGAVGEPLYQDVIAALVEQHADGQTPFDRLPVVTGTRYGLSSKEFTPAMVKGVLDAIKADKPQKHTTVGIVDDVSHSSIEYDAAFDTEPKEVFRGIFYGLGSDGTVGANKNSIKIIGEETDNHAQGYFVYDSKKAGAVTVSHLRFGPKPIRSSYLVRKSNFVACHQPVFLERYDMLQTAQEGATFLLNTATSKTEIWGTLPRDVQQQMVDKKLRFFVIDATKVANDTGMGGRINTVMQTAFFATSGVLPKDEAIAAIKKAIDKTYSRFGEEVVRRNYEAVDTTVAHLHEIKIPSKVTSKIERPPVVSAEAPEFVRKVTAVMMENRGDDLPVSAMPIDGTWPMATTQWEKRNLALEIPVWDDAICIQCGKCVMVCPHAAIRQKVVEPKLLAKAPATFKPTDYRGKEYAGMKYSLQV